MNLEELVAIFFIVLIIIFGVYKKAYSNGFKQKVGSAEKLLQGDLQTIVLARAHVLQAVGKETDHVMALIKNRIRRRLFLNRGLVQVLIVGFNLHPEVLGEMAVPG